MSAYQIVLQSRQLPSINIPSSPPPITSTCLFPQPTKATVLAESSSFSLSFIASLHSVAGCRHETGRCCSFLPFFFCVHGAIGCGQKSFTLVWWCQQLLSGFLAKGHLPREPRLSANEIIRWYRGLCTIFYFVSFLIYLFLQTRSFQQRNITLDDVDK